MFHWTAQAIEFTDSLSDLIDDQSKWSQETFGKDEDRPPIGALKHLSLEAVEAVVAYEMHGPKSDRLKEELADCFLLLLDACRRSGVTVQELLRASHDKMKVNKTRTWPTPTSNEPAEHVAE